MNDVAIARRFARFACGLHGTPAAVRNAADRAMLDTLGAMLAGRVHDTVTAIVEATPAAPGRSTLCTGDGTTAETAALVNGTAAHVWDVDDTSYTGIMHGSAVVLPAALAVAQEVGATGDGLRDAFVAGSEITYALADACTHAHYFRGWWSTATFGLIGATAAAGRLLALDETAMTHAIGIAAAAAGGGKAVFGTGGKPFLVGDAARRAVTFARVAGAGVSGPEDGFEDSRGFFSLLNDGRSEPGQIDTLGTRWRLVDPGLLFKTSPVCSAAHAAIEEVGRLVRRSGAAPDAIAEIRVEVPELVHVSLVYPDPQSPQQAQFSLPYTVACAVLGGRVRFEDLDAGEIREPRKRRLMARVRVRMAADLSTPEMRARYPESARVTLVLDDGRQFDGFCGSAYGMPDNPLSDADIVAKFAAALDFAGLPGIDVALDDFDPLAIWAAAMAGHAENLTA